MQEYLQTQSVESIACIIPPALHQLFFPPRQFTVSSSTGRHTGHQYLGTSFAAASLSKDTNNSSKAELTDEYTHEPLSTQTDVESIEVVRNRGSRLSLGESFCTTDGERYRLRNKIVPYDKQHHVPENDHPLSYGTPLI
jgi:hypothetical protein